MMVQLPALPEGRIKFLLRRDDLCNILNLLELWSDLHPPRQLATEHGNA